MRTRKLSFKRCYHMICGFCRLTDGATSPLSGPTAAPADAPVRPAVTSGRGQGQRARPRSPSAGRDGKDRPRGVSPFYREDSEQSEQGTHGDRSLLDSYGKHCGSFIFCASMVPVVAFVSLFFALPFYLLWESRPLCLVYLFDDFV